MRCRSARLRALVMGASNRAIWPPGAVRTGWPGLPALGAAGPVLLERDADDITRRLGRAPPTSTWSSTIPGANPRGRDGRRRHRPQIVGSGQGSVSTREILAELPGLAQEITSGTFDINPSRCHAATSKKRGPTPPAPAGASSSPAAVGRRPRPALCTSLWTTCAERRLPVAYSADIGDSDAGPYAKQRLQLEERD